MQASRRRLDTRLLVTNTDLQSLQDIQSFFGGKGKIRLKSRGKNDVHTKPCYILEFWANEAQVVLEELLPHLRQKREQARLVLECREFCKNSKRYQKGRCGILPLTEEETNIRLAYINRVKELKRV